MNPMQRRIGSLAQALVLSAAAALIGLFAAGAANAQAVDADPPGRVARLSDIEGQVWLYNPDSGEWVGASRNRPLTSGDRVATDPGARAELQIGSTTLRLDGGTELEVADLDDDRAALQLHNGSVAVRVRDLARAGRFELATDEGRFIVQRAGSFRFDRSNGASFATVYSGLARYEGPNSGLPLNPGQRSEFWIDAGGVAQYALTAPVNDAFTAWVGERERRNVASVSARYVSPEMAGTEDLDRYGRWEQSPDYGALWIPAAVAVDWAPYSHGHWTWVRPWGWTWVDDAPWGFAPFHYGRWVYVRNNWCWTPGERVARPVYAPALVAWIGGPRANVSISIGGGGPAVGWFPLAPREVYVPGYRSSPRYVRNINITNVTNVTQINTVINNPQGPREFENRRFPRAITVVPSGVMTERRPVAPAAAQLRQEPWVRDLANQPGRATALLSPPVNAPVLPARSADARPDPRAVRPPPGAATNAGGERGPNGRPGFGPRERDGGDRRDDARRDDPRAARPAAPPVQPATPAPAPVVPSARPAVASPPQEAPMMRPLPVQRGEDRRDERRDERRDAARPAPQQPPPAAPAPAPVAVPAPAPVAPPARPAIAPAPQEAPTMRPLPVQRGEDRRDERRAAPPRAETPAAPEARPPQRVERPVVVPAQPAQPAVAPRPVEAPRPVAVPAPVPAPAPEMKRPEPQRQRAEPPAKDEPKRNERNEPERREQQR